MATSSHKKYEEVLKGNVDPALVAFGQALAEAVQNLPDGVYELSVSVDHIVDVNLRIKEENFEYEMALMAKGEWILVGAPSVYFH